MTELVSRSTADTESAAARLAKALCPGDVVALTGGLGMGKTVFVRGLARGLGLDAEQVSSPTFSIVAEHRGGRISLCHIDAYRLSGPEDLPETGLCDYLDAGWVAAVEWSERLALDAAVTVSISRVDESTRMIRMEGRGF